MNSKDCIKEILLSEYLDGELSGDASRNIRNHLAGCKECRSAYEHLKGERSLLQEHLAAPNPPAHMRLQLLRRINEDSKAGRHSRIPDWLRIELPWGAFSRVGNLAAAAIIIVAIVFSGFQLRRHLENERILAEIERSGAQWAARDYSTNPFNIDIKGDPLQITTDNPFESYLNER